MLDKIPVKTRRRLSRIKQAVITGLAWIWRRMLLRTTFIAVTGSVGKTLCKDCLAAVLSAGKPVAKTINNQNDARGVPLSLLRVRPWHKYAVIETGAGKPGLVRRSARLVKPKIAVFLSVALTHTDVFTSRQETAGEKAELIKALLPGGTAVLNGDDPLVASTASLCRGEVLWFGRDEGSDLRVIDIVSRWPDRLSLKLEERGKGLDLRTRLVGAHWAASVLGALLGARACGIPLPDAAGTLAGIPPVMGRMQPVLHPTGAAVLRDENNGFMDTLKPALKVLREADVQRRVLVISGISYHPLNTRLRFRRLGTLAAESSDAVVFVHKHFGKQGVQAAVAGGMEPRNVWWFKDLRDASEFLRHALRKGDLVLVRGRSTDHLTRLVYAQIGDIGCWKEHCRKTILCDVCPELSPTGSLEDFDHR